MFLAAGELAAYRNRKVRLGELPLRHMADLVISDATDQIARARELAMRAAGDKARALRTLVGSMKSQRRSPSGPKTRK